MRFYKRKFLIAIICLAVSAALTWKVFDSAERSKETVTLVQASARVEKGALITPGMLRRAEVGAFGAPAAALSAEDAALGKYAACDMYPGDVITPEKLKTIDEIADGYIQKIREQNKTAVSIQLKGISPGLSGKLKPGDAVTVCVFKGKGGFGADEGEAVIYPELQYMEIAAVTNNRAEDIKYEPDREVNHDSIKNLGDTAIPATVIFIADERQAVRLVEAENTGVIHLIFRGRGEYAQELLKRHEAQTNSDTGYIATAIPGVGSYTGYVAAAIPGAGGEAGYAATATPDAGSEAGYADVPGADVAAGHAATATPADAPGADAMPAAGNVGGSDAVAMSGTDAVAMSGSDSAAPAVSVGDDRFLLD